MNMKLIEVNILPLAGRLIVDSQLARDEYELRLTVTMKGTRSNKDMGDRL